MTRTASPTPVRLRVQQAWRGRRGHIHQPITDALGQGIRRTRQNPLVGWILPVFQTPYNGLKWMLERDILSLPRQLMKEYGARAGIKGMDTPFTAEEMASQGQDVERCGHCSGY